MSQAEILALLPEAARKHLEPTSPMPARMMAAKGLVPLPPREMVLVACGIALDDNPTLAAAAKGGLEKLPDKILGPALESGLPRPALEVLAPMLTGRDDMLERLVLDKRTPNEVVASVAASASERVAEIIAANQERCMASEAIVRALRQNSSLLRSSLDRLFDFLVRVGVIYENMPEFGEAIARLSPADMEEAASKIELPPEALALTNDSEADAARAESAAMALESDSDEAKARVPILKLIAGLAVSQRVALAIKGNKEARAILIRDTNRVVATAAIRNPRITEQEVVQAAQSRSVSDEVVRIIAGSKELSRTYGVKVALVNNPKTPLPSAMRMLTLLRDADLRAVAKSKNVSTAIANQAKRLVASKQ